MNNFHRSYYWLRVINYVIILVSLLYTKVQSDANILMGFIIFLIYVCNSQLRIFYLSSKLILFFVSIVIELLLAALLQGQLHGVLFLYLFAAVLDLSIFFQKNVSIPVVGGILLFSSLPAFQNHMLDMGYINLLFLNIVCISSFAALGIYLKNENAQKQKAQSLYDQLRVSEEKLKDAYRELELFSKTVEELTLLRERNRLSRELHDSVGHTLSTLIIQLQAIRTLLQKSTNFDTEMLDGIISFTKKALENVRRVVRDLKPLEFDAHEGIFTIEELTRNFSKSTGIDIKLLLSKERWKLTSHQSHALYRILQESLSNSLRHGKAKHIQISIQFLKDQVYSQIKDDGVGCSNFEPSFGINSMRERVKELGGTLEIFTSEGKGFELTITLPRYKETTNLQEVSL